MPRAAKTDFYQNMRFFCQVTEPAPDGPNSDMNINSPGDISGTTGFQSVSVPEATIESVVYKEGGMLYPRKYPGLPSYADATLTRGVSRTASPFYKWFKRTVEGSAVPGWGYRATLDIFHFHLVDIFRSNTDSLLQHPVDTINLENKGDAKWIRLYEAFPSRWKATSDLEASDSAVSITELDVSFEYMHIKDPTVV